MTPPTDRLFIFDTTLRDGEQSPGCSMSLHEKLQLAKALAKLEVDVLEAGFPAASPGDHEAVQHLARTIEGPAICGLARCLTSDIDRTWDALREAAKPRIHVFLATSPIHREHKLGMSREQVVQAVVDAVAHARSLCDDVEFSAEDASRTEPDFLVEVVQAAIAAGASTINIPDTVGYAEPEEFAGIFRHVSEHAAGVDGIVLSAHCHDDLGLAAANSLAAVRAGARQVECTINGIGERAGNCALEEVVMAVRTRADRYGVHTGIQTERLCQTSRALSTILGVTVPPNKAIVGANAFAHEAGIHQHGVLQHSSTYEIMSPGDVGAAGSMMVLGKHSGRHALRQRVIELNYELDDDAFGRLFVAFKEVADRKKEVDDADLEALILGDSRPGGPWRLEALSTAAGTSLAHASVKVVCDDGRACREASAGDGPIDATFLAVARATGFEGAHLRDFQVRSVTVGEDAQGQVVAVCEHEGSTVRGHGISTDIVEASAHAFLDAVNRLELERRPSRSESAPARVAE